MLDWLFLFNVLPNQCVSMSLAIKCWTQCLYCIFCRENFLKFCLLTSSLFFFVGCQKIQVFFCEVIKSVKERWNDILAFDFHFLWRSQTFTFLIRRSELLFAHKCWTSLFKVLIIFTNIIFLKPHCRALCFPSWFIYILSYASFILFEFSLFFNFPPIKHIEPKEMVCIT